MEITLAPYSKLYFVAAFGYLAVRQWILHPRLSQRAAWALCLPATFLHELAHWLVALLLGGAPRMSLALQQEADGTVTYGRVHFESTILGSLSDTLVYTAPLALMLVAIIIGETQLSRPQPILHGLGWLALAYVCLRAVCMYSPGDWRGTAWYSKPGVLLFALLMAAVPVLVALQGLLHWLGVGDDQILCLIQQRSLACVQ